MRDIPPRVSEAQLPWVQVSAYHPHNSVISTPVAWRWWFRASVYTLYNNGDNCPICLIQFEQWNVIDTKLPHRTTNSCSRIPKDKQFHSMQWHISV